MDTSAAAPPPTPLKMATICGIAVIFTLRAAGTAMAAPMIMATMARMRFLPLPRRPGLEKVKAMATVAAPAPTRLPLRACRGELSPFRAMMNPMAHSR